jgi:hypothetical protein
MKTVEDLRKENETLMEFAAGLLEIIENLDKTTYDKLMELENK